MDHSRISVLCVLVACVLCFQSCFAAPYSSKWSCTAQSAKEVDEIVARIMTFGRTDRKFPVDKTQLKPYCKEQANMVARLEDYKSQCLKGRSKQTVAIIIYSMKSSINQYCKSPNAKRTTDLVASAACANAATADYNKCNIDYIDLLLAVENSKDSRQQLVQLCCGYVEVFKCIRERASTIPTCSEEYIESNVNYIRGFFDNASNLICSDYTADSDRCEKVKLLKKKNKIPSKRPQSYFNPLVHLLSSL